MLADGLPNGTLADADPPDPTVDRVARVDEEVVDVTVGVVADEPAPAVWILPESEFVVDEEVVYPNSRR